MGKKYKFRDFIITRSIVTEKKSYQSYKDYLRKDFNSRCGYCNAKEWEIIPFCIDHFVPRKFCTGEYAYLINDYNNLIFSCPLCNTYKKSSFKGDLSHNRYTNELFYNPVEINFGDIFYRNEIGVICSEDKKGKDMLVSLRLYSITHALEWAIESADIRIKKITWMIEEKKIQPNVTLKSLLLQLSEKVCYIQSLYMGQYRSLSKQCFEQE